VSGRSRLPIVTLLLIAANILAAFILLVAPELAGSLGFWSNHPNFFSAISSLFLHANLFHLLGNMVFLAAVGAAVELATGSVRFVTVYFVSGLVGVATHFLVTHNTHNPVPLIGASGCIAGCAAYYSVRYTSLKVPIAPNRGISVASVTGIWLALQIIGAFVKFGETGGTAFWAHIGGFAAGAILSGIFKAPDLKQMQLGHEVLDQMNARGPAAMEIAAKRHLEVHPNDIKALWDLANAQHSQNEALAESKTLLQIAELGIEQEQIEALRRLCQIGRVSSLTPLKRLQYAGRCHDSAPAIEKALLKSVVEGPKDELQRPDAILALAALERESEPQLADTLLNQLKQEYPLHPAVDLARKRGWLI